MTFQRTTGRPAGRRCLLCRKPHGVVAYVLHDADGHAWSVLAHLPCLRKLRAAGPLRFVADDTATGETRRVAAAIA